MKLETLTLLAALTLTLGACDRQNTPDEEPAPVEPAAEEPTGDDPAASKKAAPLKEKEEAAEADAPPALRDLPLHPHTEEFHTTKLSWKGGAKKLPLHEKPDASSPKTGELEVKEGADIEWAKTTTHVLAPRAYEADADKVTLTGIFPHEPEGEMPSSPSSRDFARGEVLYYYHYAGEGTCYVGWREGEAFTFATSNCPGSSPDQKWTIEGGPDSEGPLKTEWWVFVDTGEENAGWLHVAGEDFEAAPKETLGD